MNFIKRGKAVRVVPGAKVPVEWPGITVDVQADHPVAVGQKLKRQDGFQRLEKTVFRN